MIATAVFFLYHAMLADYMDTVFNYYSSNAEDNVSYKLWLMNF